MGLVITREGAANILDRALNNGVYFTMRLFNNNISPGEYTTLEELTEPDESAAEYSEIILDDSEGWTVTEGDLTTRSYATFPQQTFPFSGGNGAIYGYFITDENASDHKLIWAERLTTAEPYFDGKDIKITPRIDLSTRTED